MSSGRVPIRPLNGTVVGGLISLWEDYMRGAGRLSRNSPTACVIIAKWGGSKRKLFRSRYKNLRLAPSPWIKSLVNLPFERVDRP